MLAESFDVSSRDVRSRKASCLDGIESNEEENFKLKKRKRELLLIFAEKGDGRELERAHRPKCPGLPVSLYVSI